MALLVYAAKFICGTMPELPPTREGPVEPGSYATAINVHNPNPREPVVFTKKAVLLFNVNAVEKEEGYEVPQAPYGKSYRREQLGPDYGMEIDGRDIRELLTGQAPAAPVFIKGWVVIESPLPLDVVAVYTVRAPDGAVSIATDRVTPTQL
jgi:hypothetical protein